jgi:lipopolysaccharide heptosyltransferase II
MPGRQEGRRILLILDKCGPGEAVRTLPMAGAVRMAHPSADITLLVAEQAYPLFAGDHRFDRVVPSRLYGRQPRRGLSGLVTAGILAARIGFRYDLVLTLLGGSTALNLIGWLVGATRRVGYPHRFPGRLLTDSPRGYGTQGDIAANLKLLAVAGIPFPDQLLPALVLGEAEREQARGLLAQRGRRAQRPLVVLNTGSDWACQQWTPERWARLADQLIRQSDPDIVLTGLADDRDYIEQIRRGMTSASISLAGETDLRQLAAVISLASLCVSVDSAAHDLAQALGVPATVLAGPTVPEAPPTRSLNVINQTSPGHQKTILGCQDQFPNGFCHNYACPWAGMTNISVERVLAGIAQTGALTRADASTTAL